MPVTLFPQRKARRLPLRALPSGLDEMAAGSVGNRRSGPAQKECSASALALSAAARVAFASLAGNGPGVGRCSKTLTINLWPAPYLLPPVRLGQESSLAEVRGQRRRESAHYSPTCSTDAPTTVAPYSVKEFLGRSSARSPAILQAHLTQLPTVSLRLRDCESYRSHSANFPLLARGCVMTRFHMPFPILADRPGSQRL